MVLVPELVLALVAVGVDVLVQLVDGRAHAVAAAVTRSALTSGTFKTREALTQTLEDNDKEVDKIRMNMYILKKTKSRNLNRK